MSNKSRRRIKMAAGAMLAGGAIPIAAAGTAWADIDVSYDGKTIINTFPTGDNPAVSGTSNDLATYSGPAAYGSTVNANDSVGDKNDIAYASNSNTSQPVSNATITNAANSTATATNGGTATIENLTPGTGTVTNDVATADGAGAQATIENNGGTGAVSFDAAKANGTNATAVIGNGPDATGNASFNVANATGTGSVAGVANDGGGASGNSVTGVNGGQSAVLQAGPGVSNNNVLYANGTTPHGPNEAIAENLGSGSVSGNRVSAGGSNGFTLDGNHLGSVSSVAAEGTGSVTNNSVNATNGFATVTNDGNSTIPVTTHDFVNANNGAAGIGDAAGSSATAINTGPANFISVNGGLDNAFDAGASVSYATNSSAFAENPGSEAVVTGTPTAAITNSHAVDTTGPAGASIVITSNDPIVNGVETGGGTPAAPAPVHVVPPSAPVMVPLHIPLHP